MARTAATLQQSKYKQPTLGRLCLQVSKTHKSLSSASGDCPPLLAVKCLPLTGAEKPLQERKRLLFDFPQPTNQYSRPMEDNRSAG